MALKNFNGKTFVAFIDISGFKEMMKKETAGKALKDFFSIGFSVLRQDENQNISGVFISDCGIIYHSEATKSIQEKLKDILRVIEQINSKMIEKNYVLTSSIAYGDFEYQDKIELNNMSKNAFQGNAYLDTIQGYLNPRMYEVLDLANHVPIISGINDIEGTLVDLYPNPANNVLNIVSYTVGINSISIFNLNGQEVLNTTVNANQIRLNTSSLANGVYIVDIKSNNTSVKRKLIIE